MFSFLVVNNLKKNYFLLFFSNINDVTSTLDITIYDESIIQSMKGETLGKISIPLLRINNNEKKWYALKDRSKKHSAKGNCPRILLEMSLEWNPVIFFLYWAKVVLEKQQRIS